MLLKTDKLTKRYGGVTAVNSVSIEAPAGQVTGIIGPNGSGKSTLFDVISGITPKDSGDVLLDGEAIATDRPERVVSRGIVRTFQVPRVARRLTVLENLMFVPADGEGESLLRLFSPFHTRRVREDEKKRLEAALAMLGNLGLSRMANEWAGTLSGGQTKLLSAAMVLMMNPPVLLLDEPTAGVNPTLIKQMLELLSRRRADGLTTIIIEHNMDVIASTCDSVYVLDSGEIIAHGNADEVRENDRVVDAYLGRKHRRHPLGVTNVAPVGLGEAAAPDGLESQRKSVP
jgi:neutral amino acid transport system ATP-binding protein